MSSNFDDITGILKQGINLEASERSHIRDNILAFCRGEALEPDPTMLFAYEKALLFNAISSLTQEQVPAPALTVLPALRAWHGQLFSHLKPFVL